MRRTSSVHPVILCGGSGTRLWPASRGARPKQFIPLVGARSTFQETIARTAALAEHAVPLVVAGERHHAILVEQLAEIGAEAVLLLEPEGRDSAPAMAAAAAWIESQDPDGVAVFVSADHHVPDAEAFRAAAAVAVAAARDGGIVTLGARPTEASTAYGYISPGEAKGPVKPVAAFVEKPDAATAKAYVAEGRLWNSGNFVARASVLLGELEAFEPEVAVAARAAVMEAARDGAALKLGPSFRTATKISIDYAVMEKTARAMVAPVAFAWADLGAWDAVWAASDKDRHGNSLSGRALAQASADCLVRAAPGVSVAVVGAQRLAVVAEPDAVLVCALDDSQAVKGLAEALGPARKFADLEQARRWFRTWLSSVAWPVWWTLGADHARGGFHEAMALDGTPVDASRRARVQARQAYAYATAGLMGWPGPWRAAAWAAMDYLLTRYDRPDGLIGRLASPEGALLDATPVLYDHAFALLAMATLHQADPDDGRLARAAERLQGRLQHFRHPAGGWREAGEHAFQANANMHLFEAALAWEAAGGEGWSVIADEIAGLALARFIDAEGGFLREVFDADWRPADGEAGRLVEPGHQFEWAWLLERWGRSRGREDAKAAARRLFAAGSKGVDAARDVAVNALSDELAMRDAQARLWPQTEHLKAALILGEPAAALTAANGLVRYLETPVNGLWRDRMRPDGGFVEEPAPASSFYHIVCALQALLEA
jgi:mannose-1-phosphate guanylyltransferase/mannose-6-phosphate isomerase